MKLKVLGTKSPFCSSMKYNCPGFLITAGDYKILLDCGSGAHKLLNLPEDLNNLHVFLSHLHRDHYNDVYILQYASYTSHNLKRLEKPINIYLPKTPTDRYNDVVSEPDAYASYNIIAGRPINIADTVMDFLKTDHPLETYAIGVTSRGKRIAYTSDTSFSAKDKVVEWAKGADLLICESSLLTSYGFPEINSHLTARQAAIIAKEANVKKLMLTHFWPEEDTANYLKEAMEIFPNVTIAKEGQIIDI